MNDIRQRLNLIYIGVTVAAVVLAAAMIVGYAGNRRAEEAETTRTVTSRTEKEKRDRVMISTNTETIRDGLQKMGVLVTQEYYFTQVETYTKEKNIFIVIPSTSGFMYSYDGAVMAGVDFGKIAVETNEAAKTITVDLPDSEIQAVTIDKDTFKIYSEKDSIWNPLKLEDYNISLVEFEDAARKKAVDSGILERSDKQAQTLVRNFIGSLPNTEGYTVEFQ
jgi:hypothetical protein